MASRLQHTNNSLLEINCSHTHTYAEVHKRYKKQCMEPKPISTSRFITQAGGKKTPAGGQGESGAGSIFQYSPVCSTGPRRYPTSSQRTQGRQMTPVSRTWERLRGGWTWWRAVEALTGRSVRPNIGCDSNNIFPTLLPGIKATGKSEKIIVGGKKIGSHLQDTMGGERPRNEETNKRVFICWAAAQIAPPATRGLEGGDGCIRTQTHARSQRSFPAVGRWGDSAGRCGGSGGPVCHMWQFTEGQTPSEEKVQERGKMDEGEKRCLCTTKGPLLFLICSDFKVQKSVFIPGRTPSVALSHISFVGLQTNRQAAQGWGPC